MSASVQMINKIPKASKEKRSPAVDTERGAPGICFEQKRMWPSGQTNPTVWGLTVWLAWWSEQIRLDTDTIHLKYTSHSLNNWQLFTGTLTLAAGLTHKTAALLFVVQQATIWSVLYLIHKVSVSANLCPSSNTASNWTLLKKTPQKTGIKRTGVDTEPKHIRKVSYTAGMITTLSIWWLLFLASHHLFFFLSNQPPLCMDMSFLPHYHFHFKIGLQNTAQSMTHLSLQHNNIPCLSHTLTHRRNQNNVRSTKFMRRLLPLAIQCGIKDLRLTGQKSCFQISLWPLSSQWKTQKGQ